jgi:DNA-binding GntR family transcriptional regulator
MEQMKNIIGVGEGVLQYLRAHIITMELMPGQKLNEIELSRSLGISRAPLREAFRILENEHLVVSIPRKGCLVTDISMKDCQDIYELRTLFESAAIDLLESHRIRSLPHVIQALEKTALLKKPVDNGASSKFDYLRSVAEFHLRLVEAGGNLRMNQLYKGIFPSLARYQSLYTYISELMDKSQEEHEHVLRLIEEGNYSKAKQDLNSHIKKFIWLISDVLKK